MVKLTLLIPGLALGFGLAACQSGAPSSKLDRAISYCQKTTGAPGRYTASAPRSGGAPVFKATASGTLRGEILMTACVEAQLEATNSSVKVTSKPALPAMKAAPGRNLGGLPLPTQYPLLAGDPALWNTLTRPQQQRALLFLADGSTISASLRTD